ncbi:MAG: hypothetical protein KBS86_02470 [Proteobacteria bacterium]|nr:hypothetical protein [Candidatus Enterousia scatequi]
MISARENISSSNKLKPTEYTIAGNVLRAYYDSEHKLIFVIDYTTNADKQNAMLIINDRNNRKWDDILSNDYGIDLETVRPKVDTKYQKMDIEYSGLDIYDELIRAYNTDDDMDDILVRLHEFRVNSVRKSAQMRLDAAQKTIDNANETIARTNETIAELDTRISELKEKLSAQRAEIGHEPTKQSASKILRTESKIDETNEKIARAKKRIANAKRRIDIATADINSATEILNKPDTVIEQGATMADDEVKPLFDTDPNIIDDSIAFKPIEFGNRNEHGDNKPQINEPLSFTPPVQKNNSEFQPAPISDINDDADNRDYDMNDEQNVELDETFSQPEPVSEPAPILQTMQPTTEPAAPYRPIMHNVEPEPSVAESAFRPVSPVTGTYAAPQVPASESVQHKPGLMYYILLIALIILSIFTLWMYQKSTKTGTTPEIVTETPNVETTAKTETPDLPVIVSDTNITEPVAADTKPEPIIQESTVVEPEPVVVEPEPVVVEPEPVVVEPQTVATMPSADFTIKPLPTQQVVPANIGEVETAAVIDKPAYNVSQNENMFVSESDYASETSEVCPDGTNPDQYGCCTGEEYTDMGDGFGCCANGECYPPLF